MTEVGTSHSDVWTQSAWQQLRWLAAGLVIAFAVPSSSLMCWTCRVISTTAFMRRASWCFSSYGLGSPGGPSMQ
jgi:hypothetical protein